MSQGVIHSSHTGNLRRPVDARGEEVSSVLLAQLSEERSLVAVPEQALQQPLNGMSLPGVMVDCQAAAGD